jgi:hypothetical protein
MALTKIGTDGVKDDAITSGKIPANAVGTSELASSAVTAAKIAAGNVDNTAIGNNQISLNKFQQGTPSNDGKFLRANNGADPTFETVNTDLVSDTSPQLGGALASNGHNILFADGDTAKFGSGNDLNIYHNGTHSYIDTNTGSLYIRDGGSEKVRINGYGTAITGGLLFNTDTAAANALDDYEEGTWTPQIRKYVSGSFGTAAGMADNGTVQRSTYTKIGNVVSLFLQWDGFQVSDANYAAIGGLPYSTASSGGGGGTVGYTNAFTNHQNQGILVSYGGDLMYFYINGSTWNGWSSSSNRAIYLQATYLTT